ncbi:MAG: tetratricopeptide repeat protein [Candidatus Omnitrophica bacterium]|nr:tetratricopeptide repeat protein [Candidatus Omnitrophota bacterium]
MIDYFFWKLNVRGYHLTNIVLHIAAALSVYWLVNVIFHNNLLSLLTGIFFVIHPVHTEAVTYISGRADSLALLFMMLSFVFYTKIASTKPFGAFARMTLCYTLALLSRENSLILPALILAYHCSFKTKVPAKRFLSLLILAGVYLAVRVSVLHIAGTPNASATTLGQRLPGIFVAMTTYLRLLVLPLNLHMEYGNRISAWSNPKALLGIILVAALLTYAFKRRNQDRLIFFSILWFAAALLPVSNLYPLNAFMAEHWLYLPSIGFFLIVANGLCSFYNTNKFKFLTAVSAVGLSLLYSYITVKQNSYWREPMRFYERTLKYAPDSSRLYNNLGTAYNAIHEKEKAIEAYKRAIELNANYADAYYNLANIYDDQNKAAEAIAAYTKAVFLAPHNADAYTNLGNAYEAVHKMPEAIVSYKKAIEFDPGHVEAYNNLGRVYQRMNKNEEAIAAYKEAIKINPGYAMVYYNLGIVYQAMNRLEEAKAAYKTAINIKNDYLEAYNNLGNISRGTHKNQEAIASYKKIIEIDPNYAMAYSNLAIIYFEEQQYELAIEYFDKGKALGFTNPALLEALRPYR